MNSRSRVQSSLSRRLMLVARVFVVSTLIGNGAAGLSPNRDPSSSIDLRAEIRSILSDNCYACHGPDAGQRKADLRLDVKDHVLRERDGLFVIVPGSSDRSELIRRITADDPADRMPPPKTGKRLTAEQIESIRRWIDEGAAWTEHWSYVPPVRPAVPKVDNASFVRNPIDAFTLARMRENDLEPSPPADRVTLARRLHFDLIGLPPTPADVDAFVTDGEPGAYDRLVRKLLDSPHYGERMAMMWLDLIRYADSIGYHSDNPRQVSAFRDYVIRAFNENRPFDTMTVEHLAGDLLPEATRKQLIASGYNRLNMTTQEGGAQPKEYRAKYAADRVRNVSEVWLGATMGCAECHDHKFDPFRMKDFYSLAAFFADVNETAVGEQVAKLPVPDARQSEQVSRLERRVAELKAVLDTPTDALAAGQVRWEDDRRNRKPPEWHALRPTSITSNEGARFEILEDDSIVVRDPAPQRDRYTITVDTNAREWTAFRLEVLPDASLPKSGPGWADNGNFVLHRFEVRLDDEPIAWSAVTATHSQERWDVAGATDEDPKSGWAVLGRIGQASHAVFEAKTNVNDTDSAAKLTFVLQQQYGSRHVIGRFRLSATTATRPIRAEGADGVPAEIDEIVAIDSPQRAAEQRERVAAYYRGIAPELADVRAALATVERDLKSLRASIPTTLITESIEPRVMRILPRGNWMDESGPTVDPDVPRFLLPIDTNGRRANRLDLARWIVHPNNPLPARVFVNRLWKQFFGRGLAGPLDDLGAQGTPPSHPHLLDWLAVEFVESGWDVKHMVRLLVTSATYRQTSAADAERRRRDPYNRWLARQGRFRLDAEMVRDNALAISGLLARHIGGESVKPYQPPGYWAHLNFPKRTYVHDPGAPGYRRGLYTFWQRTFLHPSLLAFDAPSREECTAERARSNTPQQALVLLNDPTYVEAARVLAERIVREGGDDFRERLAWAFRRAVSREPTSDESAVLADLYDKHRDEYVRDLEAARELIAAGERPIATDLDPAELAAWTSVARVILNLHETITRY